MALDRVTNALTYRVFGCEAQRDEAYTSQLAQVEKNAVVSSAWENAMQPLYNVIAMTGVLFVLIRGAQNVLGQGWAVWDIAAFTTYLACFSRLALKSSHAAKLFNAVQKARVSWQRIQPQLQPVSVPGSAARYVYRSSFTERGKAQLCLSPPTTAFFQCFFQGSSRGDHRHYRPLACGKSTFGRLFLGEQDYTGRIFINGLDLAEQNNAQLSQLVAYAGHDPQLLSDTIVENITLGEAFDCQPWLTAVALSEEVNALPRGIQTFIGAQGSRLSGGQQARLALARTLARSRPLIILDDPFSAVDPATEAEILQQLRVLVQDRIVFLISHRLTHFPDFDQILWLSQEKVQVSSHEMMLKTNSAYAQLFEKQQRKEVKNDESH